MTKIQRRNKRLMIAERFGGPTAEAYELDPLADDSADEKKLKRAQKDAKKAREERIKLRKVRMPRRNFRYSNRIYQPITGFSRRSNVFAVDPRSASYRCWRCKGYGHYARFCRAPIPPNPGVYVKKKPCNHEFIDSHEGPNECELDVKVQNVEDFEQYNLFDEHISVSELNNSHANVKRRLKENVTFWQQIGTSPWILNILREGYSLPFLQLPPKVFFKGKLRWN